MKKLTIFVLFMFSPLLSFAEAPACSISTMNSAAKWMHNEGIIAMEDIDSSKTEINLLASEKKINTDKTIKKKFIYTNIYKFVFYDDDGKSYQVITKINSDKLPTKKLNCGYNFSEFYFVSKEGGF